MIHGTAANLVYHRSNSPLVKAFQGPVRHRLLLHHFHHHNHAVRLRFAIHSSESTSGLFPDAVHLDQLLFVPEGHRTHSVDC